MDEGTEIKRIACTLRSRLPMRRGLTGAALVSTAGALLRNAALSGFDAHSDIDVVLLLEGEACLDPPTWLPDFKFVPSNGATHREFNVFPLCEHCEETASAWPDEQLFAYETGYHLLFEGAERRLSGLVDRRLYQFRSSAGDRLATAYARGTIALRKQSPRCLARCDRVGSDLVADDGFRLLGACSFLARGLVPPPAKWLHRRLADIDAPAAEMLERSRSIGAPSPTFTALADQWIAHLAATYGVNFDDCYARWLATSSRQLGRADLAIPRAAGTGAAGDRRTMSTLALFGPEALHDR